MQLMQHSIRLSISLAGTAALALAYVPFGAARADDTKVAQGTAKDLGVMSISLKDAIQPNFGFQGALQGAGTPLAQISNQSPDGKDLPWSALSPYAGYSLLPPFSRLSCM